MRKVQIVSPIYFDGVLFPAQTVVDPLLIPLSVDALIERSWAVEYHGDKPAVESLDVLRDAMPKPHPKPEMAPEPAAQIPEPDPEQIHEPVPESEPVIESEPSDSDEPKPRKRKS